MHLSPKQLNPPVRITWRCYMHCTWRRWQQKQLLQVQLISSEAKRSRAQDHQKSAGSFLQASASQTDQSPDGELQHGRRCFVYLLDSDQNQGELNLHLSLHLTSNNEQPSVLEKSFFQAWWCREEMYAELVIRLKVNLTEQLWIFSISFWKPQGRELMSSIGNLDATTRIQHILAGQEKSADISVVD